MLTIYNDTWREQEAPVESEASFATRLGLPSVRIDADDAGTLEVILYFEDDGLFSGHVIEVFLDEAGDVTNAALAG